MALTPRLDFRQTQAPVMTPQLQQAIKLLQLSNLELAAFVDGELEENPLLKREETLIAEAEPADAPEPVLNDDGDAATLSDRGELSSSEAPLDSDYTNVYPDDPFRPAMGTAPATRGDNDSLPGIDQTLSSEVTLREHLTEQLNLSIQDAAQRLIGRAIIDSIDERGYLMASTEELTEQLGCEEVLVETVLTTLQTLEPTGVFARNLIECFSLQLAERDRLDPAMETMLHNLDYLTKHDMPGLSRICGVDQEDLTDMLAELRALNPKPGAAFEEGAAEYITADVIMRPKQGGGWEIELNNDTLPRVLINRAYYAEISNLAKEKDDRAFVIKKFQSANWLVRALDQRARTILKVATEIIRQQDAFFRYGVTHLKPLVLADIATVVKMHESTISRVTTNKYMATPYGLIELKYFFTTAINNSEGGDQHSAEAVRYKIRLMIDSESPKSVLSDDKIVKVLRDSGVDIARRTVTKYRISLKIPSSVERRRMKPA
ncbi:MAG: RNA polymerase factor sigma-54 [Alphaproteobacteria bacterium]|jgi:RNA polymerase sigma-54 factor|nr:RNA polymerase factor sigma-54 [Alphaproteobacteria bacterium]